MAPIILVDRQAGASILELGSKYKISWQVAFELLNFAETGESPDWDATTPERYAGWESFQKLSGQVVDWRDTEGLDWPAIQSKAAACLRKPVGTATVLRAYEWAHRKELRQDAGIDTSKGKGRLPDWKYERFKKLYMEDGITSCPELARLCEMKVDTAYRWRKRLRDAEQQPDN